MFYRKFKGGTMTMKKRPLDLIKACSNVDFATWELRSLR
jgi:hypothetical protein